MKITFVFSTFPDNATLSPYRQIPVLANTYFEWNHQQYKHAFNIKTLSALYAAIHRYPAVRTIFRRN